MYSNREKRRDKEGSQIRGRIVETNYYFFPSLEVCVLSESIPSGLCVSWLVDKILFEELKI